MPTDTLRSAPRPLLALCTLFLVGSFFPVRFPEAPGDWVGALVSTALICAPPLLALLGSAGWGRGLAIVAAVSLFAYAIEGVGVATGLPYGPFFYTDALGPRLLDLVPFLLPVTYVPLVLGAAAAAAPGASPAWRIATATALLVLTDAVLDPGAAALGLWVWPEGGAYYGVPLQNYLGWTLSGAVASAIVVLGLRGAKRRTARRPAPGMVDGLLLALAFWTGVALFSGLLLPALGGAALFAYLLRRRADLASGEAKAGA